MRRYALIGLPLLFVIVLGVLFWHQLGVDPTKIPSTMINKSVPAFSKLTLEANQQVTEKVFQGNVTLLNVWATWCEGCRVEHPILMKIKQTGKVNLIGIDYKDNAATAVSWLSSNGNPFDFSIADSDGRLAIDFGVYGTPETFIIDRNGIIRAKHIGILTWADWKKEIEPIVEQIS